MGYHWIRLVKQALNLWPDQVRRPPRRHQGPEPAGSPHLRYRGHPDIKCQMSKCCLNPPQSSKFCLLDRSDQGENEFDHFRTLSIDKCTMCDFPNFSTRSNNSRFSSISGRFSALGPRRKVVDTVLESSTRGDQVYDVWFPEFFNKVTFLSAPSAENTPEILENLEIFDLVAKFGKLHIVHLVPTSRRFQNCINHFSMCPQCREHT